MPKIFFDRALFPEEAAALDAIAEPSGSAVFGIDLRSPAEGLAELIAARRAGITCALFPILPDPYGHSIDLIMQAIGARPDPNEQMNQFMALRVGGLLVSGKKPSDLSAVPMDAHNAAALALRLADILLLAAPGERDRWTMLLQHEFERFALLAIVPSASPASIDESAVTLFAPTFDAQQLAPYVTLLAQRKIAVRTIGASNATDSVGTRLVFTPEWRPLRARALAAAGHHVIAPNTERVDECDSRIFGYDPINFRSILGAYDAAASSNGGMQRLPVSPHDLPALIAHESVQVLEGARVSVIVRTYDRPALLARAVASIAAQSYRNVEIVVVNNGGDDVRDVVTSSAGGRPFRYEVMPERKLISAASNVGARAATGEYIGYLDDDDLLYGDHCARTVETLNRTGADLAFTVCLCEYAEMAGDEKRILGYQIYLDRLYHTDDIYVSNISPIHSIVHRRSLFDRFGYFDESLPVTDDWEMWLRAASGGSRFIRIDRTTCEYSWRYDPKRGNMTINHQWDFVHAYEKIRSKYANDVKGRPGIHAEQQRALDVQRQRAIDADDPAKRASVVISALSSAVVPVAIRPT